MKIRTVWSKSNNHYRHLQDRLFVQMHESKEMGRGSGGPIILLFNMRRVIAYLAIAAVIAYLALATILFFFLREQSNRRVSWWQVAAPWQWRRVRQITAEESVARGLVCLRTQRYAEGLMQIESGLRRAPWQNEGRIELAKLYVTALMPNRAIQLLDTGRTYVAADPRALELAAAAGFFAEDYDFVLRYCDAVLASIPAANQATMDTARTHRISALLGAGRTEEAVTSASSIKTPANSVQAEVVIRAYIESRQYPLALERITAALSRFPDDLAIAGQRARLRRENKELTVLVRELEELTLRNRTVAGAHLMSIRELWLAGLKPEAFKALNLYFTYFDSKPANLIQAARFLVQLPHSDELIEVCLARATVLGHRQEPLWVALTEAHLLTGDLQGMRPWLDKLRDSKTKDPSAKGWLDVMSNVLATNDDGSKAIADRLVESLKVLRMPPSILATIVTTLRDANKPLAAATVANYGRLMFPNNARLAKAAESMKSLEVQINSAAETSSQPAALPKDSETLFFKKLDLALEEMRPAEAASIILEVRMRKPEWLGKREKDLSWAEVQIASMSDDMLMLRSAVHSYLQGDLSRRNQAFQFTQKLKADGKAAQEEMVLREILYRQPNDLAVKTRLAEIKEEKAR